MQLYVSSGKLQKMLFIIPTPIGNLDDISLRAVETLRSLDVLLCEDTRVTSKLLELAKIHTGAHLVSFYDEVEAKKIPEVLGWIRSGKKVGLVSDAGMPVISDPGYLLVRACVSENLAVDVLPGANAVLPALILSALPPTPFVYLGFLPKKEKDILKLVEKYGEVEATKIAYVAARELKQVVSLLPAQARVAVCTELTKKFEKVFRGKKEDVLHSLEQWDGRGEVVLVWK